MPAEEVWSAMPAEDVGPNFTSFERFTGEVT